MCLGGILAACADDAGRDGYVAAGPAGGTPVASGTAVAPTGDVTLVPLEGTPRTASTTHRSPAAGSRNPPAAEPGSVVGSTPGSTPGTTGGSSGAAKSPPDSAGSPSPTATVPQPAPSGPAELSTGEPVRQPTDRRWCEKVTVSFHNTGGSAVRSGTVTFGTHIIGALGIDWATIESSDTLPAPIAAGASVKKTWTVCVDAWRVPLGMHIETQDVSVRWT